MRAFGVALALMISGADTAQAASRSDLLSKLKIAVTHDGSASGSRRGRIMRSLASDLAAVVDEVSTGSALQKESPKNAMQAARKLGADFLLDASAQNDGPFYAVEVRLYEVASGEKQLTLQFSESV